MWKKLWLALFAVLCLCGCSTKTVENNLSGVHFIKATDQLSEKTPKERAESIKSLLYEIHGISTNAVIVEGHTAIIGLRLESGMEEEKTRLSQEADSAARQADEYINSTSITTNEKIVALIEEMERKRRS